MYKHRQIGWLVIGILAAGSLLIAATGAYFETSAAHWLVLAVLMAFLGAMIALFGWLTVTVDQEVVRVRFGIGLVRKTIRLGDIHEALRVRNKWYYGWGLRLGPWGPMFNVSGLDAVEIVSKNGNRFRIGSDEPDALLHAIRMRISI